VMCGAVTSHPDAVHIMEEAEWKKKV